MAAQPVHSLSEKKVAELRGAAPRRRGILHLALGTSAYSVLSSPAWKSTSTASRNPGPGYVAAKACPGHAAMLSLSKKDRKKKERYRQGSGGDIPDLGLGSVIW